MGFPDPDRAVSTGQSTRHQDSKQGPEDTSGDKCSSAFPLISKKVRIFTKLSKMFSPDQQIPLGQNGAWGNPGLQHILLCR